MIIETAYFAASGGVPWRAKLVIACTNLRSCGISFAYFEAKDAQALRLSTAAGLLGFLAVGASSCRILHISCT